MSISLSFRSVTNTPRLDVAARAFRLRRAVRESIRRHVERRVILAVQASGHDGVLADFERARRR